MAILSKIAYLKNAVCLFFYDRTDQPHKAGEELAESVNAGLSFAFDCDRFDRESEKELYKKCMLDEFNRKVQK